MSKRQPIKGTAPQRGRPPIHQESWSKVSVVLFDRQIVHLDRISTAIRVKGGRALNRANMPNRRVRSAADNPGPSSCTSKRTAFFDFSSRYSRSIGQ